MPRAGSSNDVVAPDSDSENSSEPSWWIPSDEEDDQGEDNPEEPPSVMAAFDSLPPVPAAPESHGTTQPAKKTPKQRREVDRPYHQFTVGSRAAKRPYGNTVCTSNSLWEKGTGPSLWVKPTMSRSA